MGSPRNLLIAAGLLLLVGVALVVTSQSGGESEYVAINGLEGDTIDVGDSFMALTEQAVIGWSAAWLATLLAAGVGGHWLATRRKTQ